MCWSNRGIFCKLILSSRGSTSFLWRLSFKLGRFNLEQRRTLNESCHKISWNTYKYSAHSFLKCCFLICLVCVLVVFLFFWVFFFFAFLFCFQRGIKIFSWKKFCMCSREMGQKWILKNFRVVWERNYFTRLWHWTLVSCLHHHCLTSSLLLLFSLQC